jgi:FkbM family methyltransferase
MTDFFGRHHQDRIILDLLNHKRDGVFVDIGATNGIISNNTFKMESDYDWKGLCIEPNNDFYLELIKNRQCICLNVCVGSYNQNGIVKFKEDQGNGELSKISFSGFNSYKPCYDFNTIMSSLDLGTNIDFLNIDTEGNEINIINDINFDKFNIRSLCYEHNSHLGEMQLCHKDMIEKILLSRGYSKVMDIDTDSIFIKA